MIYPFFRSAQYRHIVFAAKIGDGRKADAAPFVIIPMEPPTTVAGEAHIRLPSLRELALASKLPKNDVKNRDERKKDQTKLFNLLVEHPTQSTNSMVVGSL